MIPPFPSPPITAFSAFIFVTTFTSPTAEAKYVCPCASVTSLNALVEDRFETEVPGVLEIT